MKRALFIALGMTTATGAMAGSLTLESNTFAGLYNLNTSSFDTTQYNNTSAFYTGTSMTGSVSTSSFTNLADDSAYAANTSSANIFSEGSGTITVQDTLMSYTYADGTSLYTENSGGTYTFTTSTPVILNLWYNAGFTSSGIYDGFGLWNPYLIVDNTTYQWAQFMTPPASFDYYFIPLGAGTHTLQVQAWSNVGSGPGIGTEQLNETVSFYTQAVPEPAPVAALGLGALGLLVRRRKSPTRGR